MKMRGNSANETSSQVHKANVETENEKSKLLNIYVQFSGEKGKKKEKSISLSNSLSL